MKKAFWLVSFSIGVIAVASALFVHSQKPSVADYKRWMEESYHIQCLDYYCDTFQIEKTKGEEPVIMQQVHGGYSPGTFIMKADKTYRNLEDASYYLDIEVEGFLGEITLKEETTNRIPEK